MKRIALVIALTGLFCANISANIYYSLGSLSPNDLSSWNSNRLGGGFSPSSFTTNGDVFVIETGDVMVTTANWIVGGPGSALQIEPGAVLQSNHLIILTGNFQLDNGSIYIHNNPFSVSSGAGSSIFSGTEIFNANSKVEIRDWVNNTTSLPSINWGNLVINYERNLGGNWNQNATLNTVQGNFIVKKTGIAGQSFRLTSTATLNMTIGGSLEVESGNLTIKDNLSAGTSLIQVNGDLTVTEGTLDLGTVNLKPDNELRFKGNLFVFDNGVLTSQSENPFLVANGTSLQIFYCGSLLNSSFKIAKGASMKITSAVNMGNQRAFVVAGTCNVGINPINMDGGQLVVSGGQLNSSGKVDMKAGTCQVCRGEGTFNVLTNYCAATGDTGQFNFSTDTIFFNKSNGSLLLIGATNSPGKLFLSNEAVISFTGPLAGPAPNRGGVQLAGQGTLALDEISIIVGQAYYQGNGGWLVVGSPFGLQTTAIGGNIQVDGVRSYDNQNINSFEFKSTLPQSTGPGLPSTVDGTLRVNNSSVTGVTLTAATTIAGGGALHLQKGVLLSSTTALIVTMQRNTTLIGGSPESYVDGPLRKIGEHAFTYHVGRFGRYSTLSMTAGGNFSDVFTVTYLPGNPQADYGNNLTQFIDHISSVEYWSVQGPNVGRILSFKVSAYSGVTDFSSLVVARFDGQDWLNVGRDGTTGTVTNGTIYVTTGNYGPFTLGSTSPLANSPNIHLDYFTAKKEQEKGLLNWQVEAGKVVDHFQVLSSTERNGQYNSIGTIAATGTSQYQFTDPQLASGINYYRLKIVEKNGKESFSKTVSLFYQKEGAQLLTAWPSITQGPTTLVLMSSEKTQAQLNIMDAQGRLMKAMKVQVNEGRNTIPIDLMGFNGGIYYINLTTNKGRWNVKVVKQ